MAKKLPEHKEQRKKQASALLSVVGVIGFVAVVVTSFITDKSIPGIIIAFFAAVSIPPEVLKKTLKAWIGDNSEK